MTIKTIAGRIGTVMLAIIIVAGCNVKTVKQMEKVKNAALSSPEREKPFLDRRVNFKTNLQRRVKAPSDWDENETLPKYLQLVTYPSDGLNLNAILYVPPNLGDTKRPALVYYHGGFALSYFSLKICESFVNDGFVVMMPMLRGENGGEGNYELFVGELDDAANAIRWLSNHSNVDAENIYAFGHSMGGGISAMMSLMDDDLPLKHCGSSGGLYGPEIFYYWRYGNKDGLNMVPFDPKDVNECLMRVLQGNVKWMKRKHYAFIGTEDRFFLPKIEEMQNENMSAPNRSRLSISQVSGDHMSSLMPAIRQYFAVVKSEMMRRIFESRLTTTRTLPDLQTSRTSPTVPTLPVVDTVEPTTQVNRMVNDKEWDVLGKATGDEFSEMVPAQTHLVGFEVSKKKSSSNSPGARYFLVSIQPLYRSKDGEELIEGKLYGKKSGDVERVIAPVGYAVGSLRGQVDFGDLYGFEIIFMKNLPDGTLDSDDTQTSDWIGGRKTNGLISYAVLTGRGKHVSAISCSCFQNRLRSIKLEFE